MILDSSAVVAVINGEPDANLIKVKAKSAGTLRISAATLVELKIVAIQLLGPQGEMDVDGLISSWRVSVEPFDERQSVEAARGFVTYGKGRHPARLNLGDCFVYALAKSSGLPILCVGSDFSKTDALIA